MKKRLEADLVSIAHRILQLKNKSDINQLFLETQKLYEKLSVLRFVDEQYGEVRPTIGQAEIEKDIEAFYDKSDHLPVETMIEMTEMVPVEEISAEEIPTAEVADEQAASEEISAEDESVEEPMATEETTEEKNDTDEEELTAEDVNELGDFAADIIEQPVEDVEAIEEEKVSNNENDSEEIAEETEKIIAENEEVENEETKEEPATEFKSAFELTEEIEVETPMKAPAMQITFEDLLGGHYSEPEFVKVNDIESLQPQMVFEAVAKTEEKEIIPTIAAEKTPETKTISINDTFSKGINIDLNDQIAFVKHLFGNSNEDYNRVLNQLITFDNFYETRNFIEEMVKPDYNNWDGKADYEERFMDIIEKKFL
ncbi:hypothetical protein [Flavobacterium hiemivividum]|uniref:Uncharacterized protein n=1 Tax=Flavobacterium hiemivividum TaxID=2541734 RepID=A0A4R5D7S5_9FLAO|nr:hypothetical protein [Flavobacterium hiemivividum]TDE06525.1 hypothetical protein E0F98_02610 [Flavobacterium hiemivividum]